MKHYRYDVLTADIDFGVKLHPQKDMARLGFKVVDSVPVSVAATWIFRVENEIDNMPPYLVDIGDDYKFVWEE